MLISELHKLKKLFYDRSFDFFFYLVKLVIMTIYISSYFGLFKKFKVVLSRKESHIIYLRNTGSKKLNRSCQKVSIVVIAKCRVIAAVDLINIKIVICSRIVNLLYIGSVFKDVLFCPLNLIIGKEVFYIDNTDSIFIDDSFAERKAIADKFHIPVFSLDMVETL